MRVLEFEIRQRTAVRNRIFVVWHNLEMFTGLLKDCYRRYDSVSAFWQNREAFCVLCIPASPMFVKYWSAFGDNARLFGNLLLETKMTEVSIMFFVRLI